MITAANVLESAEYKKLAQEIAETGRFLAEHGWSPATSSNYSARINENLFALTRSGIDKYKIESSDVIVVDPSGKAVAPASAKPSAETLIHCKLYENPAIGAVLHTHSVFGTRISMKFASQEKIVFAGYEILKGLAGNTTHELEEVVPILPNSQDMNEFCAWLDPYLKAQTKMHGFLIAGHGLYTWGADLKEAKRHVETFEFLFQAKALELAGV